MNMNETSNADDDEIRLNSFVDESDDDLLLSVRSIITYRKGCGHYCLDIYILIVIIIFISIFLFSGIVFVKALKTRVVLIHRISNITCTKPSQTGFIIFH